MVQDKPVAIDPSFVLRFDEPHRYLVYPSVTKTGTQFPSPSTLRRLISTDIHACA
jgi:hypothetical protein